MNVQSSGTEKRLLLLVVPLLLSACLSDQRHGLPHAIGEQLAANAVNYNLAMEKSQNEMMLLNVVRAMQHRPLYITDTSKVTGTVNGSFTLGLSIPWGKGDNGGPEPNKPAISPSVTYSTSPSMDVNLLDSQDFMTGFLKPVPPELFAYYWQQGWSSEMLLYLFVLRVDQTSGKDRPLGDCRPPYVNHPEAADEKLTRFRCFAAWVKDFTEKGRPTLIDDDDPKPVGPPIKIIGGDGRSLQALTTLATEKGVSLKKEDRSDTWQIAKASETFELCRGGEKCNKPKEKDRRSVEVLAQGGSEADAASYKLTFRSPEGVLYYLGELARIENFGPKEELMVRMCDVPTPCEPEPLFVAIGKDSAKACKSTLSVITGDGDEYVIPGGWKQATAPRGSQTSLLPKTGLSCSPGRSMHALSLLSQLIALQKIAKDFPTTSTVKVVGQ